MGIVEVIATAYPNSTTEDTRWECFDIKPVKLVNRPIKLEPI